MRSTQPVPTPGSPQQPFKAGQVWRVDDLTVHISMVGKVLVHFKRFKGQSRGKGTSISPIRELSNYLVSNKATLVSE